VSVSEYPLLIFARVNDDLHTKVNELGVIVTPSRTMLASLDDDETLGLEVQKPYASLLVDGEKTTDVRGYALDATCVGKRVYVVETSGGVEGVPVLGTGETNVAEDGRVSSTPGGVARVIGWVVFEACVEYEDAEAFHEDAGRHLVDATSKYAFGNGPNGARYFGWRVAERGAVGEGALALVSYRRIFRSLHAVRVRGG